MAILDDIRWFKSNFGARIAAGIAGTPFDVDMLTAIACQETGSLWGVMRHKAGLTPDKIAALCCGDTLDANKGRSAFPRNKADLVAPSVARGQDMFNIARAALLAMADQVPGYEFARTNQAKFCHGFGVFQYDLQFFLTNPSYFLNREYENFDKSLARAIGELKRGLTKLGLQGRTSITDDDFCKVAIVYNTGGFDPSRGLRQGHRDGDVFYGQAIQNFLVKARQVATPTAPAAVPPAPAGTAPLPPANELTATGPRFIVDTQIDPLRLRKEAKVSNPPTANIRAEIPDGTPVRAITGTPVNGFMEIEVELGGEVLRGFASAKFLVPATPAAANAAAAIVAPPPAAAAIPEANLPNPPGVVTRRTEIATARSLNEPDMPSRTGTGPTELRAELGAIIDYLATEKPAHKRYQPRDGRTFCNIYVHDYCTLAKVYIPRTWWTAPALLKIAAGQTLPAKLGTTVDEMRANDLFRWLRDFGQGFGWRRSGSLTELQAQANLGGVSLIVARRKEDGKPGHIVAVVPETVTETALRDASGNVTMPLQSQAGSVNFRRGRGILNWWKDAKFAEAAFWVHA